MAGNIISKDRMKSFAATAVLIFLSGCTTAQFSNIHDDNFEHPFGFAGGSFSCEGANACQNGLSRAERMCDERPMNIVDTSSRSFIDTAIIPFTNTSNQYGTLRSSSGSSYSYTGTTTQTNYVPVNYTRTIQRADFICSDSDVIQKVYTLLASNPALPPICTEVPMEFMPGSERLWRVAHSPSSEDCSKQQSWIKYLSPSGDRRLYLFIGDRGNGLCRSLEKELSRREISGPKVLFYLQNTLVCN